MPVSYLTREGYQKLQAELDYLRGTKRLEVANRLHEAMEGGELIEDAEYEAAKNEQAFVEGRILELEQLLASARIIQNGKSDVVQVGTKVTIKEGRMKEEEYYIVGEAEANPREGRISHLSPLGKALLDHKAGESVEVSAPSGAFTVKIVKVE